MKYLIGLLIACVLFLGACDIEREPPRPGPYGEFESETLIFVLQKNTRGR